MSVTADQGVATFVLSLDPAPAFELGLSAEVPDPNASGGSTSVSTQMAVGVGQFPDQLVFVESPPSSVSAGAPFSMTVAAVDSSGQIDTAFNQLVILGGLDPRGGGIWSGHAPISGERFAVASRGVATFTDLSIGYGWGVPLPGDYSVWSPDISDTSYVLAHGDRTGGVPHGPLSLPMGS